MSRPSVNRVAVALVVLLGAAVTRAPAVASGADMMEASQDLVLHLESGFTAGSAVVVFRQGSVVTAVTADHVVKNALAGEAPLVARARPWPDLRLAVEVLQAYRDSRLDLAVVRFELPTAALGTVPESWARIALARLDGAGPGARFRFVGHPSEPWIVSPQVELQGLDGPHATFHYHCAEGLSGGAIFDRSWRLVGMTLRRRTRLLCEAITAEALSRVLVDRWGVRTSWGYSENRPDKEGVVRAVYLAAIRSGVSLPRDTRLDRRDLEYLLADLDHGAPAPSPENAWKLSVDVVDYAYRPISESAYGTTIRGDLFQARLRLELVDPHGVGRLSKSYEVEVVDHDGAGGFGARSSAPVVELLKSLAEQAREDLKRALGP